jgi:predicted DNA-binding protein
MSKTKTFSFRLEEELLARLDAVQERTGIDRGLLARAAISAVCDHFEKHGSMTMPFRLVPMEAKGQETRNG